MVFCFQVLLNTPTKIYIPAEDKELPEGLPNPIASLPPNPSVEQLQTALKTLKPTCAGIVSEYSCGNHDTAPAYGGEIISVNAGDEVAMNTMIISIVDIDGSGNGSGLIKVPMRCDDSLNNIKLGVTLSGIKVAQGGCIVAGKAETSGIDVAVLNEKQRQNLAKAYEIYKKTLDIAEELAPEIAKGINSVKDNFEALKAKKEATRKLLAQSNLEDLSEVLNNCGEIVSQSRTAQDSLEKTICLIKAGKAKGNIAKLEKASKANIDFINKLGPALVQCQSKPNWQNWEQTPCKGGPCADFDYSEFECKKELKGVFGVKEDCVCENLTQITTNAKGSKIGDVLRIKNCIDVSIGGLGGQPSLSNCTLNLYYFLDENKKGKWYKKAEFEELVLPYLESLVFIQKGRKYETLKLNERLNESYNLLYDWQVNRGISNNWVDIEFSSDIFKKVDNELWKKSTSGKIDYSSFDPTDLLIIFSKPLLSVAKSLTSTLGSSAYLLATKGTKTAALYYLLNTSERKLIANITENGILTELNFLKGNIKKYETLIELKNVSYLKDGTNKYGGIKCVLQEEKVFWIEIREGMITIGSELEKSKALVQIMRFRDANKLLSNTQMNKNLGFVEGNMGEYKFSLQNTIEKSGPPMPNDSEIFTASTVGTHFRNTDSEYQMLTKIANLFGAKKGDVFPNINGKISVVSEFEYCGSCSNVIEQFHKMFPNVDIVKINNLR